MIANDEIDDGSVRSNKEKITDLLDKRHRERLINLDTKHELSKQKAAADENHEYFIQTFRDHVKQIDDGIVALQIGDPQLSAQINKLIGDINHLQNYLTASTLFLSNYTVKTCQTTINELKTKLDATKSRLIVKKKFGFRSKTDTALVPPASAAASKEHLYNGRASATPTVAIPTTNSSAAIATHINWTVQNRHGEEIVLDHAAVDNQDITISNLTDCIVRIVGHPGTLQVSHLTNCIVLCGPVCRSIFADHCTRVKFSFGCQQLRLHSSSACDIYMHVTSRAIIEDCTNVRVAGDYYRYDGIEADYAAAGLDIGKNNWNNVADFNWLSTNVPSPNWSALQSCDRIDDWHQFISIFRKDFKISI